MKQFPFSFIFTSCILFFISLSVFAQQQNEKKLKWQVGVQVNTVEKLPAISTLFPDGNFLYANGRVNDKSYSAGITLNYLIKENFSLRIKFDYLKRNIIQDLGKEIIDSMAIVNLENSTDHAEITEQNFYFAPGTQWNYVFQKLNIYYGLQTPVNIYGKITVDELSETYNFNPSYVIVHSYEGTGKITIPGGYSFGTGTFLGGGISLGKHFTISSELTADFLFYSIMAKGNTHFHTEMNYIYPPQPLYVKDGDENYTTVQRWFLNFKGTIKLSYKF